MSGEDNRNDVDQGQQGEQAPNSGQQNQGGQPASGQQPQGGQQAHGQPRGGQRAQGQPQGGQSAQGGQAYAQAGQQQYQQGPGLVDKLQQPPTFDHLKATVAIFTLVGVGIGIIAILIGAVDQNLLSASAAGQSQSFNPGANVISGAIGLIPLVAAVLAVWIGVRFAENIQEDETTVAIAAAVAVFVGTVLMWVLGGFLASTQLDAGSLGSMGSLTSNLSISLKFGGLLVNSIVGGIGVGIIAGGTAYIERTLAPST